MPPHSKLARLQQAITLVLLGTACGWLAWHWPQSPVVALVGVAVILMGHGLFLALEFLLLFAVDRGAGQPQPTAAELLRAWLGETLTAPRVFCWRQPFCWRAEPDHLDDPALRGRRGAVFVHGFVCNRGFWTPWLKRLRAQGHAFVAVNLEPVFGSIDQYAAIIEDAVDRVTRTTGLPPVLVCHSMGGLAARAWLRTPGASERVDHVVTIGTPHRGTWLARFSHLPNGRQMRVDSAWLRELAGLPGPQRPARFTCWYSNCDNIVFPVETATLPGADNRMVRGVAHVDLAFAPEVMQGTLSRLAQ
jgi:pimeloyl-ACP methyl ester carboxylesterase